MKLIRWLDKNFELSILAVLLGIIFFIIGNYMPQIRSNYTFGIKTPWTLESPAVWKKTHAMGGIIFCVCGVLTIAAGIFAVSWAMYVMLAVILLGSLWLYVYSWLLYRKER